MVYLEGIDKEDEKGNVMEKADLDKIIKEINKYTGSKKPVFLFLYLNGCDPCNSTKKEWVKIPDSSLDNKTEDFLVTAIDQEKYGALQGVGGKPIAFPTIRYIEGGKVEEYNGGRTTDDFVKWINGKQGSGKKEVQTGGFIEYVLRKYKKPKTSKKRKTIRNKKTTKTRKTKGRPRKTKGRSRKINLPKSRTNKKGGFLINQSVSNGSGFSMNKTTGQKRYNWTTGKWDYEDCYGFGPFKTCTVRPAD